MKKTFRTSALCLMACAAVFTARAQQALTLKECVSEALRNNIRMREADNSVASAHHDREAARTKYFPTVSASGTAFTANKGLVELSLSPEMGMTLLKNGVTGAVTAMQPVFAGGQIVNGNRLAEVGEEVSRLKRNMSADEVRLTTEQYFWQVVMLKEKLHTIETVEKQLESIHRDVDAAVTAGVTNRNDLLQVRLRQNETRSSRVTVENALATSRSLLSQFIGRGTDSVDVAAAIGDELPGRPESLYREPETALTQTNEYALLQQNVKASRLQYRLSVGKNLPTVAVGGGYMYNDFMDKGRTNLVGMATVSIPISSWWGGSHDMKKAKLARNNAEMEQEDNSQLLIIRMRNAWNALTDAYKQVEIAQESINQADENLRLHTDYYAAGTCTMSDLLEAQTLYRSARDKYVESYAQYEVKKIEYLQATGQTSE